jgi:hypothetical protein
VSYRTLLELYVVGALRDGRDADSADPRAARSVLRACRAAAAAVPPGGDVSERTLEDLGQLLRGGRVSVDHPERELVPLLLALTAAHVELTVGLRGLGEEFEDVWVRYYHRGRAFKRHPLDRLPRAPRPAGWSEGQDKGRRKPH